MKKKIYIKILSEVYYEKIQSLFFLQKNYISRYMLYFSRTVYEIFIQKILFTCSFIILKLISSTL